MILIATGFLAATVAPTLDDAVSTRLQDISFTTKVATASRAELRKINPDFALGYEAETVNILWKEPMMIRLNSTYNGQAAVYVINGNTKSFRVPRVGYNGKEDVSKSPGKRQTLMDFGLISPSMKSSFLTGTFIRTEGGLYVFDLKYQVTKDTSRHRVWVDPARRMITKRMWFGQKGELMATFLYEDPVQAGGVWIATKTTVKNAENKTAGSTRTSNIQVNTGINASNFKI
jgi:outer membrane lipoprotein-sorting protein